MKRGMVILSLIVLVGCSHAQPRRPDPRRTSGADAELFLAVFRGNSNQVALALQRGANINARHLGLMEAARLEGATPLYAAVLQQTGDRCLVAHARSRPNHPERSRGDAPPTGAQAEVCGDCADTDKRKLEPSVAYDCRILGF